MHNLVIKFAINAAALWLAALVIDGLTLESNVVAILVVAAIFGVVNTLLKPMAKFLSFPLIILTVGLFTFVVNAAMLGVTAWVSDSLQIDGIMPAILGAVVITFVSWILSSLLGTKKKSDIKTEKPAKES